MGKTSKSVHMNSHLDPFSRGGGWGTVRRGGGGLGGPGGVRGGSGGGGAFWGVLGGFSN